MEKVLANCEEIQRYNIESKEQLSLLADLPLDIPNTVKNVDGKFSICALAVSIGLISLSIRLILSSIDSGMLLFSVMCIFNFTVLVNIGLRSNRRGLAIIAAVITGLSLLISIINYTTAFGDDDRDTTERVENIVGDIEKGTWSADDKTFTNEWSGLTLTLPEGYRALSAEEI